MGTCSSGIRLLLTLVAVRKGRAVTNKEFWFLLFATQLPDLVDKTLGWSLDVLPSGRSLAHSLFTTVLLVFIVSLIGRRKQTWLIWRPLSTSGTLATF